MINQQLIDYINEQLKQGVEKDKIKGILLGIGWKDEDIEEAFWGADFSLNQNLIQKTEDNAEYIKNLNNPINQTDNFNLNIVDNKRKLFNLKFFIIVILIVLLISGGVFGYEYYMNSPQKVIQNMIKNIDKIKTVEGEGVAKINIIDKSNSSNYKSFSMLINFQDKLDINDINNPREEFKLNMKVGGSSFDIAKDLKLFREQGVFDIETRAINKIFYVKLKNLPKEDVIDVSFINDQWIKIDPNKIKSKIDELQSRFDFEGVKKQLEKQKEIQKKQELTPEKIKKIQEIIMQSNIIQLIEKLKDEKIENIKTYHYKIIINREEFKKVFFKIIEIYEDRNLTDEEINQFNEAIKNFDFSNNVEILVGKKDYLPYKVVLNINIKNEKYKFDLEIDSTILVKNYNQPVKINIPFPAKNIEEILDRLFAEFLKIIFLNQQKMQNNLNSPTTTIKIIY